MVIVSDTSPVTNLIQIDRLDILKSTFQKIIIPHFVFEELCKLPHQKEIIEKADWIEIQSAKDTSKLASFQKIIDRGEAEAIVLTIESHADYLLIDEIKGRTLAEQNGLRIIGLLGVLLKTKNEKIISEVKTLADSLIEDAGFRVHPDLYKVLLIMAGE